MDPVVDDQWLVGGVENRGQLLALFGFKCQPCLNKQQPATSKIFSLQHGNCRRKPRRVRGGSGGGRVVFVVAVVLFRVDGLSTFLALFCPIGRHTAEPLLDFQALFARVLGPTSSKASASSGLLHLRGTKGESTNGWLGPATVIGTWGKFEGVT